MAFPSTLTSFTYPTATQKLNSPSHSSIHVQVASAIGQIEAIIGTDASTLGTIIGDLRSASSNGGGHVQTAVKGGTGQTSFTKGDLLVATATSVLSKLAVGTDGQIIKADSSVAAGIKWAENTSPKVYASVLSSVMGQSTENESSIFSVTIPGSTLGTGNVVRAVVNVSQFSFAGTTASVLLQGTYGGGRVASVLVQGQDIAGTNGLKGTFTFTIFGNGATNAQYADLQVAVAKNLANQSSVTGNFTADSGTASVASTAPNTIGMTAKYSTSDSNNALRIGGIFVEKIT